MGKPLCRLCKIEVETISQKKYQAVRAKSYPGDPYEKDVY